MSHGWIETNRGNGILNRGQGDLLDDTTCELRLEGSEGVSQVFA